MSDRKAASAHLRPRGQQTPGEAVGGLGVVVKEAGKVEDEVGPPRLAGEGFSVEVALLHLNAKSDP